MASRGKASSGAKRGAAAAGNAISGTGAGTSEGGVGAWLRSLESAVLGSFQILQRKVRVRARPCLHATALPLP